ncbi:IS1 family transposase, partial [Thomasclavelia sp.]|uniref:IS1/IS1595 family N-terminal zinc-binding domain-containing protein n=1 Tax=Thomasclavelia sp. TaxID=3025757 RepID=UPI0025F35050
MITEKQVVDFLKNKDISYIENLMSLLTRQDFDVFHDTVGVCPVCGSSSVIKHGKDKHNHQRYFCRDCHKTFTSKTGTLLYWTHLTVEQWKKFIDYELSKLTLEDEAHFVGVSITTCFYMCHKLYSAATEIIRNQILSEEVQVDTQYLKINLKGTKPQNMPRYSKKRGNSSAYWGISHHKVSVICAVDSQDHMIMNITGLGSESFEKYKANDKYFQDISEVISDSKTSIQQFANHLKAANNKIPTSPLGKRYLTEDGESLGAINEMMSEINGIITKTKGISTRYAQGYIDFNILRKQMKYQYKR